MIDCRRIRVHVSISNTVVEMCFLNVDKMIYRMDNITKSSHTRFTMFWFSFLGCMLDMETEKFIPLSLILLKRHTRPVFHIVEGFGNPTSISTTILWNRLVPEVAGTDY